MAFSLSSLLPIAGTGIGAFIGGPGGAAIGGGLGGTLEGMLSSGGPGPALTQQQLDEQLQRERDAYAQQQQLAQTLRDIASGKTPSVASADLGAGLDQINRSAQSMAAGARGNTGALARYTAMLAAAQSGAQANQAQAVAAARERAAATQQLGGVLGSEAQVASGDARSTGQELDAVNAANAANKQKMELSGLNGAAQGLALLSKPPTANPAAASGLASGQAAYSAGAGVHSPTTALSSTLPYNGPDINPTSGTYVAPKASGLSSVLPEDDEDHNPYGNPPSGPSTL